MHIFSNRFDSEFQEHISNALSLSSLINSSFPVAQPRETATMAFSKCCRIDYMGLSATTLLDVACNYILSDQVPLQFANLFQNASDLNQQGIFIKIRFLFMYPYATSFFSLIQAESSTHRSAVDTPAFLRDFRTVDEVDEAMFYASTTIRNLRNSLEHLQELIQDYGWNDESPNTVRVRFTPVDVNLSLTIINDAMYYSPYLLAKSMRLSERLALMAPVVYAEKTSANQCFAHFEDHFRYLWDLDTTILCEDATAYDPKVIKSLSRIRPPSQVSFDSKALRIEELRFEQSGQPSPENEVQGWKFRLKHILQRFSTDTKPTPSIESVFIACSWDIGKDGKSKPNKYARMLADWLETDFGTRRTVPLMSVHVLEAATGGSLAQQVYARLREATLAIVILTKDFESKSGEFFTKPNVLHELGYLMRQLDAGRLVILREEGVTVPSNIRDNVYIDFQSEERLTLCYREVVLWLNDISALTNPATVVYSLNSHMDRLSEMVVSGHIQQGEGEEARRRIGEDIKRVAG